MTAAAFFDIDGTLLAPPSLERQFLRYLVWRKELRLAAWRRWLGFFLTHAWHDPLLATHGNKAHYAGLRATSFAPFLNLLRRYPMVLFPGAVARIQWHVRQGHHVFLVSGTLQPLAEEVADVLAGRLLADHIPIQVLATRLEQRDGCLTGRVLGEAICGRAKARAVSEFARRLGLDLHACFAYGNSGSDRWMLEAVGHPAVVNPSPRLRRLAQRRGWPVLAWGRAPRLASEAPDSLRVSMVEKCF